METTAPMIRVTNAIRTKKPSDRSKVYVDSVASKIIDDFFVKNQIYALPFKCLTWNSLKRKVVTEEILQLREIFGEDAKIKWSAKAGCSCGCSPGYVVSGAVPPAYRGSNVWVSILGDASHISKLLPEYKKKLDAEISKKSS